MLRGVGLALLTATSVQGDGCTYTDPGSGTTFDLSPLMMGDLTTSSYHVRDMVDSEERNYTYAFNVCGDIPPPVPACETTKSGSGPSPAFQVFKDGQCRRLGVGGDTVQHANYAWNLIDRLDPTRGVSLTYMHGDPCHKGENTQRSMTIHFVCSDSFGENPDERVDETYCDYSLVFETVFGCPTSCPFSNRKLCGGNGFCGMDSDLGAPRCFCMQGFFGEDCSLEAKPLNESSCGGTCVALSFAIILLVALLTTGGVIFFRVRRLSLLNDRFGELSNSFARELDPQEGMSLTQSPANF